MSRYTKTMMDALADVYEKFESRGYTTKQVKMAIGIASDPRYKQGNYTGAVNQIEKIKKGLSKHPQVAAVLKRQNEEVELDEAKEPFAVVDTADGDKVVGTASSEKGAKEIITTAQLPPMKIKDKKTLKIVKTRKKQDIGYPLKEETELDEAKVVVDLENDDPKLIKDIKKFGLKVKDLGSSGNSGYNEYEISGPQSKIDAANKKLNLMAEGKMKAVAMKIDSIVAKMKKNKEMKSFADKFKKDAMKSMDIAKSLEKVLPDYIAGKDIAALVKEETIVESWELDEMKMDDPKLLKIFDKLKKGSTVKIKIDSSISKGKDYREFTVTAKNIVGKGKKFEQEKITLKAKDNPTGVKHFLYNRDGKVTLAIGDMGASIADIKEDNMSAYTAAITKGVK